MRSNSKSVKPIARCASGARAAIFGIIALASVVSASCGGTSRFEGTWIGEHQLPAGHADNKYIANSIKKVEVTIKPNGTFEMSNSGIPKSGSIRSSGDGLVLEVETLFGKPIRTVGPDASAKNPPINLEPQSDGSLKMSDPGGVLNDTVTLRRVPQPPQN